MEQQLFFLGCWVPAVGLLGGLAVQWASKHVPAIFQECLWNRVFGIYCFGCGGTRAFLALCRGHVLLALWYHPLVVYGAVLYLVFMVRHLIFLISKGRFRGMRFRGGYLYAAIGIMLVNFIVKNLLRQVFGILMEG